MKSTVCITLGLTLFLSIVAIAPRTDAFAPMPIEVTASPQSIMLDSVTPYMTIHTDIKLSAVDRSTLDLSGIAVDWVTVDNHGNLVAKIDMDAVKAIVAPPRATLVLSGLTIDGQPFEGADTVTVVVPRGK